MASDELSQLLEDFPEDTLEKLLTAATESRKASKKHKLSQILQALADEGSIKSVIAQLKTSVESTHASIHPRPHSVSELVSAYKEKQANQKASIIHSKKRLSGFQAANKKSAVVPVSSQISMYSLNFCRYRKSGLAYKRTTGNVQIGGFTDDDTYIEVVNKGARGLDIRASPSRLYLIVSNGIVVDAPLQGGKTWSLGCYIQEFGGTSVRGKKQFGIYIPIDAEEDEGMQVHRDELPTTSKQTKARLSLQLSRGSKRPKSSASLPLSKRPKVASSEGSTSPSACGTGTRSKPIDVDLKDGKTINLDEATMKTCYYPIKDGLITTSLCASGREGVWRLVNLDFHCPHDQAKEGVSSDFPTFQPELSNFVLVGLSIGGVLYMGAELPVESIKVQDVHFHQKEKMYIHSKQLVIKITNSVPLLMLSPQHATACYKWEHRIHVSQPWKAIDVPEFTCLLFADRFGHYRCSVDEEEALFTVKPCRTLKTVSATPMDLQIPFVDLTFLQVIGKGAFAVVHKGTWKDRVVALKKLKLPPDAEIHNDATTHREIVALRNLKHPNIVQLHGYAISGDELVLVMNYVDGYNLEKILFGKGTNIELSSNMALTIALKIVRAVQHMHNNTPVIIHQDLKPQNILISRDVQDVLVCDLGIAKLRQAAEATCTSAGKGPGTVPYMAPEMFQKAQRGRAVDVYSLGCLLAELVSHRRVWPGLGAMEIMAEVCGSFGKQPSTPDMSHVPAPYREICHDCCQLDSIKRPSIDVVLEMLSQIDR